MKTCKDCIKFEVCLMKGDVVIHSEKNLVCDKLIERAISQRGTKGIENYFVKAKTVNGDSVCGPLDYSFIGRFLSVRDKNSKKNSEVIASTICRNSGILDFSGNYMYEFDLVKLRKNGRDEGYGFLWWNELHQKWVIRRFLSYSGYCDVKEFATTVCGNIALSRDDEIKIYEQGLMEESRNVVIDNSYCPSKFKK